MTSSRRRVVSIESIRKANQNMIEGKSALNNKDLPYHIKEEIRRRHYSVEDINAAYGRTLARMTG